MQEKSVRTVLILELPNNKNSRIKAILKKYEIVWRSARDKRDAMLAS